MRLTAFPSRWLSAGLLLLGAWGQAQPLAAREPVNIAVNVAPALWQVKDADTTIYLFGTVHVLKPGIDWFKGGVKQAFDASDELVLEIIEPENPGEMAQMMAGKAMATDRVALSTRLAPDAAQKYRAAMVAAGVPWQSFEAFNPWMAGMILSVAPLQKLGYQSDIGAEKILRAAAEKAGKKVGALETVEQQLNFFADLPMAQQVQFLNATVEGMDGMEGEFAALLNHWQTGQPEKLADEMNDSLKTTPELAQVLLINRNANWAKWIKARLDQPGTVFVAVGAGHLAGKGSVQDQLKTLGIASARVKQGE